MTYTKRITLINKYQTIFHRNLVKYLLEASRQHDAHVWSLTDALDGCPNDYRPNS